jgi:hypothetical protein
MADPPSPQPDPECPPGAAARRRLAWQDGRSARTWRRLGGVDESGGVNDSGGVDARHHQLAAVSVVST